MIPLSILDLVSVAEGRDVSAALAETAALAQCAEGLGYNRFWIAEHHLMPGIAGGATSVVIGHVAAATKTIRVGSGGIMLPNHSPLAIAEQFGTLDALFPGRIDLGLGRAPGADMRVARAMRRDLMRAADEFPQDVVELRAHFTGDPDLGLEASPGRGASPEMWILGSSLFGAQLAAALGMPYAFASHFAPDQLLPALEVYRRSFRPSAALAKPYAMAAMNVFAADSKEEAVYLASSMMQAFVALRTGTPGKLRKPVENYRATLPPQATAVLDHVMQYSAIGSADDVREKLSWFRETTRADEIIIAGATHDPVARQHSLKLAMEAASG
jgi:luciferase family oxidoreductase group 1